MSVNRISLNNNSSSKDKNIPALVKKALDDPIRKKHDLNITFHTHEKKCFTKGWNQWITEKQTDEELKKAYKHEYTSYAYLTGYNGLFGIDFDWEWPYILCKNHFAERFETYTVKTPNNGYRVLFITDKTSNNDNFKNNLHVELQGGKPAIVFGKAKNNKGELKKYQPIITDEIRYDSTIQEDVTNFLSQILKKYEFLEYKCIRSVLIERENHLTHEQRLHIANFFMREEEDIDNAAYFFSTCNDFEIKTSRYQLNNTKNKIDNDSLNYPTCAKLIEDFNWDENNCRGCIRKKLIDNPSIIEEDEFHCNLNLKYPTRHLRKFKELSDSTRLYGDEYKIIKKALWYNLTSLKISKANLKLGQIETDGRLHLLFAIKSGKGKGELKRVIKYVVDYQDKNFSEPTSLHAEQLVGKTLNPTKNNKAYQKIPGFLSEDYLIIDEAYSLLTSKDLHYSEARKYIRTATDPYPYNEVTKKMTDVPKEHALKYTPHCLICVFVQPFVFDNDDLVLEGDIRRFVVVYTEMTGLNRVESYHNRIFGETDHEKALKKFSEYIESLKSINSFKVSEKGREIFFKLSNLLIERGFSINEKIRNFMDHVDYTIQNILLKMSAIQAAQDDSSEIKLKHVELAFIDLLEILEHMYLYVDAKIPGYMNYGEGWKGALTNNQICLRWLHDQGATSLDDTQVSISDYKNKIIQVFNVKERQAGNIKNKHLEQGWIKTKKGKHDSYVWLNFKPETRDARDASNRLKIKNLIQLEYEQIIDNL